jgi:hypothetical protein
MANMFIPVVLADGEEVVFYTVTILAKDKSEVRIGQHIGKGTPSSPLWRANMLRSLADTIELEAKLQGEE